MINRLIELFEENQIEYWTSGKNVSKDEINITCPFCSDHSNHLSINPEKRIFYCRLCKESDSLFNLLIEFNIDRNIIRNTLSKRQNYADNQRSLKTYTNIYIHSKTADFDGVELPNECSEHILNLHRKYLLSRNFDSEFLTKKYNLKFVGPVGKFKNRIIIPIFYNRKLVHFTSRDVTNKQESKYLHESTDKIGYTIHNFLYNIDTVKSDKIIIIEGVTDVWRMGDGFVCSFGYSVAQEQIALMMKKNIKNIIILFDNEERALKQAEKTASELDGIFNVNVFKLPFDVKDPGELSIPQAKELRRMLLDE